MQTDPIAPTVGMTDAGFSDAQPLRHFIVLSVVSLGLYPPYWMYRTLKLLAAHRALSISPLWRTFFAFLPVIGWPIFKDQLQLFADTAESAGIASAIAPWPHTLGFQLLSTVGWLAPTPWSFLGNAGFIFLLPAQRTLNAYWSVEQPGRVVRTRYSTGEVLFAVVCAVMWGLLLAMLFIADRVVA